MTWSRVYLLGLICGLLFASAGAQAAQTIKGTLLSTVQGNTVRLQTDAGAITFTPAPNARIMRGEVGKELEEVASRELAPGDHIVAVVDQDGRASSIKAFYLRIQGRIASIQDDKLYLSNGKGFRAAGRAQIVLPDGRIGTLADVKPGMFVVCRVNPVMNWVWTVVATSDTSVVKPSIRSVTYSAPTPLKSGDIITVDLAGTAGAKATFEVKNLIPATSMKELSPGKYRATAAVPKDKGVLNAPLIGRLKTGGASAPPVQAAKLVTVVRTKVAAAVYTIGSPVVTPAPHVSDLRLPGTRETGGPEGGSPGVETEPEDGEESPEDLEVVLASSEPETVEPASIVLPRELATVEAVEACPILITSPAEEDVLDRSLSIAGTADPESAVRVTVTYANSKTGMLRLSGLMTAQDVAVGKNGEFRMGPIFLAGPFSTEGLRFTVSVMYVDRPDSARAEVSVGGRQG